MRISNNLMAYNAQNKLNVNNNNVANSVRKLSSGLRISRAGDDAAGLAISEKMRGQIKGLDMASKNSQDAISLIQTAEGALNETHSILQRMRELSVQSASDTNNDTVDREALQSEFNALRLEVNDIANDTQFNNKKLLNGDLSVNMAVTTTDATFVQVGLHGVTDIKIEGFTAGDTIAFANDGHDIYQATLNSDASTALSGSATATGEQNLSFDFGDGRRVMIELSAAADAGGILAGSQAAGLVFTDTGTGIGAQIQTGANEDENLTLVVSSMKASSIGIGSSTVANRAGAEAAITSVDSALNAVSTQRSKLGAYQNRLEHKIKNLDTSSENLQAAESRIRDLDMAAEMTEFTSNNILSQAATSMLAQANSLPQNVLKLLG